MDDALLRKRLLLLNIGSVGSLSRTSSIQMFVSPFHFNIKNPLVKKVFVIEARDRLDDSL